MTVHRTKHLLFEQRAPTVSPMKSVRIGAPADLPRLARP
jgi:hypothetical protein